jgi:hypothetical protein
MERVSRMNAPLDLTGQLGAFLIKKEVARGATVARTPYRSLASRANNYFTTILENLINEDQWMIWVAKMFNLHVSGSLRGQSRK